LAANFHGQAIVDFGVPWHRSFGAILRIEESRMPATFAFKATPISLKVSHQFVALHNLCAPAPTDSGKSSIKSASAAGAST